MKSNDKKAVYLPPSVEATSVLDDSVICASVGNLDMPDPWTGSTEQEW
mgnify:CR=1 FL=1